VARVVVLADDLIWQTRLANAVRSAGATPERVRTVGDLERALASSDALVVDLTARAYEPLAAIVRAKELAPGVRVLAVGQHDDAEMRREALAAGAERVFAYRKLFEDGPGTLARWLGTAVTAQP
jgi:DNA-binding NtrC family response regulator